MVKKEENLKVLFLIALFVVAIIFFSNQRIYSGEYVRGAPNVLAVRTRQTIMPREIVSRYSIGGTYHIATQECNTFEQTPQQINNACTNIHGECPSGSYICSSGGFCQCPPRKASRQWGRRT